MIITVPATSANLGPGFDTLGLAMKFHNTISIKKSNFSSVSIKGEGAKFLKTKRSNIFLNIFEEKFKTLTDEEINFRFEFDNKIPISRGMGSSSAVIVSALYAAYAMADWQVDKEQILNEALKYEPHPDNITPAVFGGLNTAVAQDGKVYRVTAKMDENLRAVMVIPNKPISTRSSRNALPKKLNFHDAVFNVGRSTLLFAALTNRQYDLLRVASEDRYHQFIRMKFLPELFEVQKLALKEGALMSTLSGSGSSFFSLASDEDSARRIAQRLEKRFSHFKTLILEFDNEGVRGKKV